MKLNLRGLEAFRETMLSGSVTAAASRMGMTQPAVSRLISQLEQDAGFGLFYRDRGRLSPTPEAVLLYDEVNLAFGGLDRVDGLVRDIAVFNSGNLKIVAPPSMSEGVLAGILPGFMEKYPKVRISIDSRSTETAKAMVVNRTADCGFAKLPLNRPEIATELVSSTETVCVLRRDHPLARHEILTPQLLNHQPLIQLGHGSWTRALIDDAFKAAGLRPDVKLETHTVGSACAFASQGLGIALANGLMARHFTRENTVVRVFRPQILHEYVFITSALAPMNRLARAFLEEAKLYFAQQPATYG
jgi:DNA-binding transcriptional LysR family regulator